MLYKFNSEYESEKNAKGQLVFGENTVVSFENNELYVVQKEFKRYINTLMNNDKTIEEQIEYLLNKGIIDKEQNELE